MFSFSFLPKPGDEIPVTDVLTLYVPSLVTVTRLAFAVAIVLTAPVAARPLGRIVAVLAAGLAAWLSTYFVKQAVAATPNHPGVEPPYLVAIGAVFLIFGVFLAWAVTGRETLRAGVVAATTAAVLGVVFLLALSRISWPSLPV